MRFILSGLGNWYRSWKLMAEAVPLADELGFWGVVIPDHYMWQRRGEGGTPENSTLDSWVALTYLAAKTSRLKLGTLVTPIPFRPPATMAKMVSTLDVLSNGRTILGSVRAGHRQSSKATANGTVPRPGLTRPRKGFDSYFDCGRRRRWISMGNSTMRKARS